VLPNTASSQSQSFHILGDEKVLTVSELSHAIKGEIDRSFASIKLQGEVSGLKNHSSGHTYLSLKDNDSVINAICWRGTKINFPLEDGIEIVVRGRVTTYPARSQYQFIIEEANVAGEGALLKLLNERKKYFASLGYFDENKKQPIPKFPRVIGIVTSKTGAVLQDMRQRLEIRYPLCYVMVWPVNVQGVGAAEQVATAVRGFNFMSDRKPDVIIVARGGGSIEDLWPFNEEVVVRAVYDSKIPVISAIGHETDTTLIDYAADRRAPTPTAAIELATPVLSDIKLQIMDNIIRMKMSMKRIIRELSFSIISAKRCLSSKQFVIIALSQKYDDRVERLNFATENYMNKITLRLQSKKTINLTNYFSMKKQSYDMANRAFLKLLQVYIGRYIERAAVLSNRLEQSSFRKILEKGFCFITDRSSNTIETVDKFKMNRSNGMIIHFKDGFVEV
jgi:exodeoxyribonuclease VII large subunit